jgi:hypothetical protein
VSANLIEELDLPLRLRGSSTSTRSLFRLVGVASPRLGAGVLGLMLDAFDGVDAVLPVGVGRGLRRRGGMFVGVEERCCE